MIYFKLLKLYYTAINCAENNFLIFETIHIVSFHCTKSDYYHTFNAHILFMLYLAILIRWYIFLRVCIHRIFQSFKIRNHCILFVLISKLKRITYFPKVPYMRQWKNCFHYNAYSQTAAQTGIHKTLNLYFVNLGLFVVICEYELEEKRKIESK